MSERIDSTTGIKPETPANPTPVTPSPFGHCVAGLHLGAMTPRPVDGEFDAILTLAREAGHVPDLVRHRHLPMPYGALNVPALVESVDWVLGQVVEDRKILVRSEKGRQRPGFVIAAAILKMGGTYQDAITCVRHGRVDALTDFRYLDLLKFVDAAFRAGKGQA